MAASPYPPVPPFPAFPPYAAFAPYSPYPSPPPSACAAASLSAAAPAPVISTSPVAPPLQLPPAVAPPVSQAPQHVSRYNIHAIGIGPSNYHEGSGYHERPRLIVDPSTVSGTAPLQFFSSTVRVTTMLFQLDASVVPNWFGVAIPNNTRDFSKPNIFFHPIPAQAGYQDADYPTKTGLWPQLFYYLERLGYQIDAAIQSFGASPTQIVVMPFLTSAATGTGILPAEWQSILTDILSDVRFAVSGVGNAPVTITEVAISSFSVGLVYSNAFRNTASGLKPLLKQVWDFDGYPRSLASSLVSTSTYQVRKYEQVVEPSSYYLPLARWSNYPAMAPNPGDPSRPTNGNEVHHAIRDFMFLHAATLR